MAFKLDRLSAYAFIVQATRAPTREFIALWEKLCKKIETQENSQDSITEAQAAQQAQIVSILESQGYLITAINANAAAANAAAAAANAAQTTADAAGGSTAQSGFATNDSINLPGTSWITGPIVNLTAVVAGNLTLAGSGPQWDDDVFLNTPSFTGKYRVVEVIGGVDGTTWEFNFSATRPDPEDLLDTSVLNNDAAAIAAFSVARVSTGAVSYRMDAQRVSGGTLANLTLYIFVRRA